ncbi:MULTISPECIES: phytanoyl-CoA dioxygenase family protein [Xanthocytophaga]|uniref:Phytanoyl-CoA dioxygenase family protein n=2 Tax=Xanthocytophaga TaxID=3078918 RepID=A0AAE3QZ50_9BACT|nr:MULTISPECIES: phytanoyl-CoA dioxygenase family protein [Xanthocytophaga]MDJ1485183.1 phytanoyl-CoA dioxygenase family protein [Xanthocytophaga flavus]MDJ1504898.1 phytanoyl-CoA dioxygenase family protein [Xanthocytophaga agilis]
MAIQYPKFTLGETLTAQQIEFFNTNGFIHFKNFIKPETVQTITDASLEVQKRWLEQDIKKINGVPIKYGKDLNGDTIVQRFAFINQHHPVLGEFLEDPRFTTLLNLIGPGARLGKTEKDGMVFNHYVNGPESKFSQMGWHVDGLRDIFHGGKLNPMLNVGIHLSNLKPENGGLRLIPGTHKQGLYQLLFRKKHFLDHKPDAEEVAVLPEAGDLTVHDGRLWHRVEKSSVVGESSRRRVIYVPIIAGKYEPKNENSPTAFYQRFAGVVK